MNILFLDVENPIGNFIERRIRKLSERDDFLIYVLLFNNQKLEDPRNNVIPVYSNWIHIYPFLAIKRLLLTFPASFLRTLKIVKYAPKKFNIVRKLYWSIVNNELIQLDIDIIHLQFIGSYVNFEWLRNFYKTPWVSSARGSQVTILPFTREGYKEVIRSSIEGSDFIHCVSNSLREKCLELGADDNKIIVNYNGLDTNKFKPQKKEVSIFRFITVGSLSWRKGLLFQLLAFQDFLNNYTTKEAELIVIGEGSEKEAILYYAKRLGIEHRVHLLGYLKEEEVINQLQRSHIYLTTSAAEGLANSVMEALSCGLPVIGFDCEGMEELIEDGKNGFIAPFGEIGELTKRMVELSTNLDRYEAMSSYARDKMVREYDIDYHVNKIINFYKNILKKNTL